jgi:hypothetical protein
MAASFGATCVAKILRIVSAAVGLVIAARNNATNVVSFSQTAKKLGSNASATSSGCAAVRSGRSRVNSAAAANANDRPAAGHR